MSRKNKNASQVTESATATQEAPPVDQVAQTEPTTEPIATPTTDQNATPPALSAADQIKALKAQLAELQAKAKAEGSEKEQARTAANAELEAAEKAWSEFLNTNPEATALRDRYIAAKAKVKELGGHRTGSGNGKAPGNHKGDPTEGKGLTAYAFRFLKTSGQPHSVKEIFQGAKDAGWTPKEGARSDDDASMAQLSSSLVQELKRPTPFVTRPEKGKYQIA